MFFDLRSLREFLLLLQTSVPHPFRVFCGMGGKPMKFRSTRIAKLLQIYEPV